MEGVSELSDHGMHLLAARLERGFSQGRLAKSCGLSQTQISLFESGKRLPSLEQFLGLARVLEVPLQRLLTGTDRPGVELRDLAIELRGLGAIDLWVADAVVPGASRTAEEVIALAASGRRPNPRVVEMLPALLSWNPIDPVLLHAQGVATKTLYRLAWLADIALAIEEGLGFPGGCRRETLEVFVHSVESPKRDYPCDDMGHPVKVPPRSSIWRRWRITYGASLDDFSARVVSLASTRKLEKNRSKTSNARIRLNAISQ